MEFFLVGTGGMLGSVLRYGLGLLLIKAFAFPTVVINLIGSFLIGVLISSGEVKIPSGWALFLVPGLLGGFTTYSTFSGELMLFLKDQAYVKAAIYFTITVVGGLLLTFLGYSLGRIILTKS